ncbi:hypothetical protein [Paraburkholderia humisilvae]|uniref:hypothetical protein n=1 Tax=Paraburkholderia humisilvae TaxID=627669 RepID=UPI001582A83F
MKKVSGNYALGRPVEPLRSLCPPLNQTRQSGPHRMFAGSLAGIKQQIVRGAYARGACAG